jgi:protein-tyrosine phosphatase
MEIVLRNALAGAGASTIRIASAGTTAIEGMPVALPMQDILRSRDLDPTDFRSRQLTSSMLARADIVITAERSHRRWVTRLLPDVTTRTFTLIQTARLLSAPRVGLDVAPAGGSVAELVRQLDASRGHGGAGTAEDDIEDPWGRSRRVYRRSVARMDPPLAQLARFLIADPERRTTAPVPD